ncbi:MAG: hypothetical protein K2F69_06730 [Bacteroidaceae bacterium]|nr:hypothetical protein [Bacteroidaceae bacterium]MDE6159761.1 hypothetical protein [Bacteroidaceae bacterium]
MNKVIPKLVISGHEIEGHRRTIVIMPRKFEMGGEFYRTDSGRDKEFGTIALAVYFYTCPDRGESSETLYEVHFAINHKIPCAFLEKFLGGEFDTSMIDLVIEKIIGDIAEFVTTPTRYNEYIFDISIYEKKWEESLNRTVKHSLSELNRAE